MREKFENILKEHGIYGEDVEDVLCAVHDMFLLMTDELKEKEPYAVHSINRLENAAYEAIDLTCYL